MFTLKVENENGQTMELTQRESDYQVIGVEGLDPPKGEIIRTSVSGMDGSQHASSRLEERNMVLTIRLHGEVANNRIYLYQFFKSKHWCKLYYRNDVRDVYIEGWVETIECDHFSMSEVMQVSVVCPDPYFKSLGEIYSNISQIIGAFEFPFAHGARGVISPTITDDAIEFSTFVRDRIVDIVNEGENDTGLIITVVAEDTVVNPVIYNVKTREAFTLNITMLASDKVTINTGRGEKSVILTRGSNTTNLINKVARDSVWLTLAAGDNLFTYDATEGEEDMQIVFTHRTRYEAV